MFTDFGNNDDLDQIDVKTRAATKETKASVISAFTSYGTLELESFTFSRQ
jgi:hypothetical protein